MFAMCPAATGLSTDPYWSSVSLLTNTTSVNGATNNVFLDSSANNFTITNVNLGVTQGTVSPFTNSGGSGYFDGSSYMTAPDNAAHSFGATPFTVEGWFYSTEGAGNHGIIGNFQFFGGTGWRITTGSNLIVYGQYPGGAEAYSTVPFATNTWNHFAVVGDGTTVKMYLNGVVGSFTAAQSAAVTSGGALSIGKNSDNSSGVTWVYSGYLSDIRIVKGTAIYTGTFTPSTTPLTAVTNTQLLLNFKNAGIYDAAKKNNMYTKVSAQVSTTQKKWYTTSLYLDGSSYVYMPNTTNLQFVAGDFTIDGWVYPTTAALQQMINQDDAASNNQTCTVRKEANNALTFIYYTSSVRGSVVTATTSNTMPLNAWSYIAISRTGSTLKMYINGVQGYSASAATMYQGTNPTTLGAFTNGLYAYMFTGYMQDIRITKGVGRYPTTCAVPSAAFRTR